MRWISMAVLAALVAGCGADGPPKAPSEESKPKPGLTVSGSVSMGVTGGSG